jgi:hypothetical protein
LGPVSGCMVAPSPSKSNQDFFRESERLFKIN